MILTILRLGMMDENFAMDKSRLEAQIFLEEDIKNGIFPRGSYLGEEIPLGWASEDIPGYMRGVIVTPSGRSYWVVKLPPQIQ